MRYFQCDWSVCDTESLNNMLLQGIFEETLMFENYNNQIFSVFVRVVCAGKRYVLLYIFRYFFKACNDDDANDDDDNDDDNDDL